MTDEGEYSEVSQLRTRCTILESQVQLLSTQNADLKAKLTIMHPDHISSTDKNMEQKYKEIPNVGKFPLPQDDDGSFQI
jgi:hypothetical protein